MVFTITTTILGALAPILLALAGVMAVLGVSLGRPAINTDLFLCGGTPQDPNDNDDVPTCPIP